MWSEWAYHFQLVIGVSHTKSSLIEKVKIQVTEDSVIVRVGYRHIDLEVKREFEEGLREADAHARQMTFIDLEGVEYVNSAFIGALLSFDSGIRKVGRRLCIIGVSPEVLEILKMLRLDEYFEVNPPSKTE